jgi:hypothetical protein
MALRRAYVSREEIRELATGFAAAIQGRTMHSSPASRSDPDGSQPGSVELVGRFGRSIRVRCGLLPVALFLSALSFAQTPSRITHVEPSAGKVDESVTASGDNLAKPAVGGVFLSDDKNDYKATIVEQVADKIVMKVPHVAPGGYNVSIQVGTQIFIQPVRFTVEQ